MSPISVPDHSSHVAHVCRRCIDPTVRHGPGIRYVLDERNWCVDAWYECACPDCTSPGGRIHESYKSSMMGTGQFEPTCIGEPGRRGAYVWLAHSGDDKATWKHIGQDHDRQFVRGGEEERKEFTNLVLGLPFDPSPTSAMDPSSLEARTEEWTLPDGSPADAPEWAEALFADIDCQQGSLDDQSRSPRVEISIHAVGRNRRRAIIHHIVISHREVLDRLTNEIERIPVDPFTAACSDMIWEVLACDYVTADGRLLRIKRTGVDNSWRTDDAQQFCMLPRSKQLGILPVRGASSERGGIRAPLLPANLQVAKSPKSGRMYLWVGTQTAKDTVGRLLAIPPPGPESLVFSARLERPHFRGSARRAPGRAAAGRPHVGSGRSQEDGRAARLLRLLLYAMERMKMRKNARLRKLVDEIDPAAVEAAIAAQAEAQAALGPVPATPSDQADAATVRTVPEEVQPALERGSRFRVVSHRKRASEPDAKARQGIGWREPARPPRPRPQRKDEHRMVTTAKFDPFFLMSDEELEQVIRDLAAQIASGAVQISSPEAGSAGYLGRVEALRIMKNLQRSYFARRGVRLDVDRIRYTQVIVK